MKIKKGDQVKIMLGKDQGKTGKVLRVFPKKSKVWVEGINIYKRHVRSRGQNEGGIIEIGKPVNVSNVMLICSACKKATRIGFQTEDEKLRVCKKCREVIK